MSTRNPYSLESDTFEFTAEIDLMKLGVLIRYEVDVQYYCMNLAGEVVIADINEIWAAGVFERGYDGPDYRANTPKLLNVKVTLGDLTEAELATIKAEAKSKVEYELERARD
jgi:hypothetical protein